MPLPQPNLSPVLFFFCSFHFSFFSQGSFEIQQDDVSISYLPLAHMFERMIQVVDPLLTCFSVFLSYFFCV